MSQRIAPPPSTPYGAPILLEASKKAMAAAEAEQDAQVAQAGTDALK